VLTQGGNGSVGYRLARIERALWGEGDTPGLVGHVAGNNILLQQVITRQRWVIRTLMLTCALLLAHMLLRDTKEFDELLKNLTKLLFNS
jgi:hypothetical protein